MPNKVTEIVTKVVVMLGVIPALIYVSLSALNDASCWFWAVAVGIGNFMLIAFSPKHSLALALRQAGAFDWAFAALVAIMLFLWVQEAPLMNRILHSLFGFISFVGYSCTPLRALLRRRRERKMQKGA